MNEKLQAGEIILTHDRRLRVFVSSTIGELADERRAVARAVSALRLTPVMFELGARPHPPRETYRAYLGQSDVFVGLYWQHYGRIVPGMRVSGLEDEFDLSEGLPRLVYVKAPAPDREPPLADLLARIGQEVSYRVFRTPRELNGLVRDDLAALMSERFGAQRPPVLASVPDPASAAHNVSRTLPAGTTSLIGRDHEVTELTALIGRNGTRLVTLTGPGGVGKTRLAVAVGEHLRQGFDAGAVFVPLAPITEPERALTGIALAVGAELAGTASPLDTLTEYFGDDRWLLILDNLEQVATVAPDLETLLEHCRGLTIVATSRRSLSLRAEQEYPVAPLPLATDLEAAPAANLALSPAVALFLDRARAVHPDFALTEENAAAVSEICQRMEGLPLAIELAAARTRLLRPTVLLERLSASLDALGTGGPYMPERQRTLRATVEWSISLLDDAQQSLLETFALFVDGWTLPAAAYVSGLEDDRALEVSETLARDSLIQTDGISTTSRYRMLQTIREFVIERLALRDDAAKLQRRHADFYWHMAERTDRWLRGGHPGAWLEGLDAESGNLAAAVRWYLANDPAPLPHLFRVLWPLWFLRDIIGDGRSWVRQLLPKADSFDHDARAELTWTALVAALEVGDDEAALAARVRLEPLLTGIDDRFLHAAGQLAAAWSAPITGDFDGGLRAASNSLEELRGQDEPFWTALALGSVGGLETALGHLDDALAHLTEQRDLGDQFGSAFLSTWSRALLSALSIARGRTDEAQAMLDEALGLSLTARSTRSVTLCLTGYARLAFAEADPERAAFLAGATNGIRRRAGLQSWPTLRQAEAELKAQVRRELGTTRFDEMFTAGSQLSRQDAVDAVRQCCAERKAS